MQISLMNLKVNYHIKITKQRQVTLPAKLIDKVGILKGDSLIASETKDGILIEKAPTLDEIAGSLHKYAIKNKSIEEIMKMEDKAINEGYLSNYNDGTN